MYFEGQALLLCYSLVLILLINIIWEKILQWPGTPVHMTSALWYLIAPFIQKYHNHCLIQGWTFSVDITWGWKLEQKIRVKMFCHLIRTFSSAICLGVTCRPMPDNKQWVIIQFIKLTVLLSSSVFDFQIITFLRMFRNMVDKVLGVSFSLIWLGSISGFPNSKGVFENNCHVELG